MQTDLRASRSRSAPDLAELRSAMGLASGTFGTETGRAQPEVWSVSLTGGLHEWFGEAEFPVGVLIGLAWRAVGKPDHRVGRRVVWVGRRCWPYPPALVRWGGGQDGQRDRPLGVEDRRLLEASVFVDPASRQERVWAVELSARCGGVGLVVGDGSGLTMAESRRLQLAAGRTPVLLGRPGRELGELSAARTRWRVSPTVVDGSGRDEIGREPGHGWSVELLRCKGLRPGTGEDARRWVVRREHGRGGINEDWQAWPTGDGGVASAVGDGPDRSVRSQIA